MGLRPWEADPVLEDRGPWTVVRDDLLPGGSKTRFLPFLLAGVEHAVFGGPFCGGAPWALATVGKALGVKVTLFYAARAEVHPRQRAAFRLGAEIRVVRPGYMTVVQARAREFCRRTGATFLPLGFDVPAAEDPFVAIMRGVRERFRDRRGADPDQVWCATGSGMLARCLAKAFPSSKVVGVRVGLSSRSSKQSFAPNVELLDSGVPFERTHAGDVPFSSDRNYDAKAWSRASREARGDRLLFWNVAGDARSL